MDKRKQWLIIIGIAALGVIAIGGIYFLGRYIDRRSELPPSQREILKKNDQDVKEVEHRMTSPDIVSGESQSLHEFDTIVEKCSWSDEQARNFRQVLKNELSQYTKFVFNPDSVNYSTELAAETGIILCDFTFSIDDDTYTVSTNYQSTYNLVVLIKKGEEVVYSSPYS